MIIENHSTHPVLVSSPPAWISSLHDGWRTRKQNTNCKNVADGPPSHASLCTDLLSCRSVYAVHPLPSRIVNCCDTRLATSLSADRGESRKLDRDVFTTVRHVPDAYRTMVAWKRVVRATVGFRYGPRPVLFLRFLHLSDGGEREVGRSVRSSGWDPDARRICPPTVRGGGFSCPSRLLLLHHLVLHPRDALPLSAAELPREASSTASSLTLPPAPFACSPLLTPPPSLHLLLFRPLLPPLHVATTTTVHDTTTAAAASTTPPPPPSPGLPHLQSRPGGFPTT